MLYNIILVHDGWNGFESDIYIFNISIMMWHYNTLPSLSHFSVVPQMNIPETGQDGLAKARSHTHPALVGSTFSVFPKGERAAVGIFRNQQTLMVCF